MSIVTKSVPGGPAPIPLVDLAAQLHPIRSRIEAAIGRVLDHGQYILGPEIEQLEAELAAFCGVKEAITCANGTDALALVLMAKGVGSGDAVLCPSFTFAATAEVVAWTGATPVFVDVCADTFNLDASGLMAGVEAAKKSGLKPVGVIPVDLFGQAADYDAIESACAAHDLWMLCDGAQSFGALYNGKRVGTFGLATTTSFFPAKPFGCYGDGGAVFTDDLELAAVIRSLRVHGQGVDKYDNERIGLNARLDTIQAAVLIEKLKIFPDEVDRRNAVARRYNNAFGNMAITPRVLDGCVSTWAQYTLRIEGGRREAVMAALKQRGIPTAIYYPKPVHRQAAYRQFPAAQNGLPVSDRIADEVLSLPIHAYLDAATQDYIIDATSETLRG